MSTAARMLIAWIWHTAAFEILLLLAMLWGRLMGLAALPVFYDESLHILSARAILAGPPYFVMFSHARWLNVMILALFQPMSQGSLWLARAVSVVLSLLTAVAAYYLGRWIGNRAIARLALGLYAIMPFAYFYDRQAMSDPIMASFGALSIIVAIRAARRLSLRDAIMGGGFLALAALTKFAGVVYAPLPLAIALLLPSGDRRRALALAALQCTVFAVLFGSVFVLALRENGGTFGAVGISNWCHSPQCAGRFDWAETAGLVVVNIRQYADTIPSFYSPVVWILAVAALWFGWRDRRRHLLILSIPAFLAALPFIFIADLFPPRYLMFTLAPVAALAAFALHRMWAQFDSHSARGLFFQWALALAVSGPALGLVIWQAVDPLTAPLPSFELTQYKAGWPTGIAAWAIIDDLRQIQSAAGGRPVNLIADDLNQEISVEWGPRHGTVASGRDFQETQLIPWLAAGDPVCLVEVTPKYPLAPQPYGLLVESFSSYPLSLNPSRPNASAPAATLWCAVGVTDSLSHKIADYTFGDPGAAADYYRAAADMLRAQTGPILLYPSNQLELFRAQPGMESVDLRPLLWPVEFGRLAQQAEESTRAGGDVWAVFVFEERHASARQVQAWLYSTLYRVEAQYAGPIKILRFKAGAARQEQAIGESFGGVIELSGVTVSEPEAGALRASLTWKSLAETAVSYKFFVHVFDESGQLVAQRDDYPHADLTPTNIWRVEQVITDRFAVLLPPDLPKGTLTVKAGLYDPATGVRLVTPDGIDSVDISQVVLR